MIRIRLFVADKDNNVYNEFHNDIIKLEGDHNALNMDNAKMFIIKYLPDYLKSEYYRLSLSSKNSVENIDVYFDYNKYITRDLRIKKVLDD